MPSLAIAPRVAARHSCRTGGVATYDRRDDAKHGPDSGGVGVLERHIKRMLGPCDLAFVAPAEPDDVLLWNATDASGLVWLGTVRIDVQTDLPPYVESTGQRAWQKRGGPPERAASRYDRRAGGQEGEADAGVLERRLQRIAERGRELLLRARSEPTFGHSQLLQGIAAMVAEAERTP